MTLGPYTYIRVYILHLPLIIIQSLAIGVVKIEDSFVVVPIDGPHPLLYIKAVRFKSLSTLLKRFSSGLAFPSFLPPSVLVSYFYLFYLLIVHTSRIYSDRPRAKPSTQNGNKGTSICSHFPLLPFLTLWNRSAFMHAGDFERTEVQLRMSLKTEIQKK